MGVEAKGFSAAQNKAAVWGVSGVQGSLRDNRKGQRSGTQRRTLRINTTIHH
jgi:hypothetical protein